MATIVDASENSVGVDGPYLAAHRQILELRGGHGYQPSRAVDRTA
jgi:hypothetical protein